MCQKLCEMCWDKFVIGLLSNLNCEEIRGFSLVEEASVLEFLKSKIFADIIFTIVQLINKVLKGFVSKKLFCYLIYVMCKILNVEKMFKVGPEKIHRK